MLHTGQHYDPGLSDVFFDEFGLDPPKYRLEAGSGTHAEQTARMLPGIETAVLAEQPDWVLVYGDTNSTLAGALAAAKLGVPVAHVEAGLRSFDRTMPEELNRIVVDRLSELLFCPTGLAARHLAAEAVTEGVHVVGDVMLDANLRLAPLARERSQALAAAQVEPGRYLLLTLHRPANNRGSFTRIATALEQPPRSRRLPGTSARHARTRGSRHRSAPRANPSACRLPRLRRARLAGAARPHRLGRSSEGGVLVRSPVRDAANDPPSGSSGRAGWNRLTGDDPELIARAVAEAGLGAEHPPLYGDGHAAERVAELLCTMRPGRP